MKKHFTKAILASLCFTVVLSSCKKEINTYLPVDAYAYSGLDSNGGNWKPIVLSSGNQVQAPQPDAVSSASYQQELANLKTTTANVTGSQKDAVAYWGVNSLIRWDEIASNLAAKYNLQPAPNDDGTYSAPDANNPSAYPPFPFANPPYTSRMYSYWSGAAFDALITVWNQKYKYNRAAPYKNDASIQPLLPANDLPSYPSEDAAIAAVSEVILSAMFPLEKDYIKQKADELKNVRMWAGMNTTSDITVGDSIGRQVAAIFINRSKTDGMKTAGTTKAVADSLENVAQAQWGWHWENLDFPQRPVGILPFFGKVKPWFIPNVETVRPGVPPAPGSSAFNTAADELKGYDKHLDNDKRDIALFWNDGPGTYTPPGHWNVISFPYVIKHQMNTLRTARMLAYLNMSMMDAGISCWDTKFYYHYPRPSGAIPGLKTCIGIPNFPSYSSGHSIFSSTGATVLSYFFPEGQAEFERLAQEAADSRVYSRIHYRFDADAGISSGKMIGAYATNAAALDGAD